MILAFREIINYYDDKFASYIIIKEVVVVVVDRKEGFEIVSYF